MSKLPGLVLVVSAAMVLAVAPTAMSAKPKPGVQVVITKNCPAASAQKTYNGRVIIYVSGNGCVSIDKGATAIASGNAVVAAHGDSSVVAKDQTTLVVYNEAVSCVIRGRGVTVVSAIEGFFPRSRARCQAARQ